jgi:hypothetical protein
MGNGLKLASYFYLNGRKVKELLYRSNVPTTAGLIVNFSLSTCFNLSAVEYRLPKAGTTDVHCNLVNDPVN